MVLSKKYMYNMIVNYFIQSVALTRDTVFNFVIVGLKLYFSIEDLFVM